MLTLMPSRDGRTPARTHDFGDEDVVEVELLLPARQLARFEAEARRQGLTVSQLVRRVLGSYLRQAEQS